jgi:hypothetical protein
VKTRTTRLALSHSEGIFEVEIVDEGTGEYVMVSCGLDRAPLEQHITIDPSEWPFLRDAIDRMFVEIAEAQVEPESKEPQGVASEDGWIPWEGGECPVEHRTNVLVRYRNAAQPTIGWPAGGHRWGHTGMFTDIITYKVVE